MDASDALLAKASEYEIRSASCSETASLRAGNGSAAVGFALVAIAPREVAEALAQEES